MYLRWFERQSPIQNGVVPTKEISKELGKTWEYRMPEWVRLWDESDQKRPWQDVID